MELDPTLVIRTTGRAALPLEVAYDRDLVPADFSLLDKPRDSKPAGLKEIRLAHHAIAKAMASGKKNVEIAAITGYSQSRLSILKGDPAFAELVEFYKANADLAYVNLHETLSRVSHTAVAILEERMLDNPDAVEDATLIDIAKMGADRTGHGPQSKSTNINVNIDMAKRLEAGRARVQAFRESLQASPVIEGLALPSPTPAPGSTPNHEASNDRE